MADSPFKIFIAYSRQDANLLEELRKHLRPLERTGKVKIWYDGRIEPGAVWEQAIKDNLHDADIILLLVSADAINSDYFYEKEMSDALARHHAGEARVVPLIVRSCLWQATPLKVLQALPKDGRPVTNWPDRDDAYSDAIGSLWSMLENQERQRQAVQERIEAEFQLAEEQARQWQEAERKATEEASRRQKEQEAAAERQRQLDEQRRRDAAEAERRHQQEDADRQKRAEEERQQKATIALRRKQKLATLGRGLRSPWAWGSGVALVMIFVFNSLICNKLLTEAPEMFKSFKDSITIDKHALKDSNLIVVLDTLPPKQQPFDDNVQKKRNFIFKK
ncbi:MAG: TIR domain-containing protein [Saprospiraceae bacterium]|nr:TIR domain-containing protein [Saprospiraceae bacterium]